MPVEERSGAEGACVLWSCFDWSCSQWKNSVKLSRSGKAQKVCVASQQNPNSPSLLVFSMLEQNIILTLSHACRIKVKLAIKKQGHTHNMLDFMQTVMLNLRKVSFKRFGDLQQLCETQNAHSFSRQGEHFGGPFFDLLSKSIFIFLFISIQGNTAVTKLSYIALYILLAQPMFSSIYPQPTIVTSGSPKPGVKFPEDVQVILRADRPTAGNLFIGNVEAAENKTILQNLRISAVLCVAKGYGTKHSSSVVKHAKYLAVEDDDNADLSRFLGEGVAFIAEKIKNTNVLVHCVAGTNRSAVFVMAYLMKEMGLSLEDAFNEVKSRRKIITPSEGMIAQLKDYEKTLTAKINSAKPTPAPSIRFNQPSSVMDQTERSIKIKINENPSNFLEVLDQRSARSKAGSKMRMDEFDERKSQRASSCHSHPIIEITQPKGMTKNPEESFISRQSKAPSVLNKSFYAPSQASRSQYSPVLPEPRVETAGKSTREEFMQKLHNTDCKNREINHRIETVQERFDHSAQSNRMEMESKLNELTQLRSSLLNKHSQRKGKVAQRRALHDKSMEIREVQEYMASLPLETAVKRKL